MPVDNRGGDAEERVVAGLNDEGENPGGEAHRRRERQVDLGGGDDVDQRDGRKSATGSVVSTTRRDPNSRRRADWRR